MLFLSFGGSSKNAGSLIATAPCGGDQATCKWC
jgi:hypothetical protein